MRYRPRHEHRVGAKHRGDDHPVIFSNDTNCDVHVGVCRAQDPVTGPDDARSWRPPRDAFHCSQPDIQRDPRGTAALVAAGHKEEAMTHDTNQPPGFETDIRPMFRESDRRSMRMHFDLWSHDDVSQHADAIFARLSEGNMPCDGSWPQARIDLFQRWAESGKPR